MTSRYEHPKAISGKSFSVDNFHLTDGINAIVYRILNGMRGRKGIWQ